MDDFRGGPGISAKHHFQLSGARISEEGTSMEQTLTPEMAGTGRTDTTTPAGHASDPASARIGIDNTDPSVQVGAARTDALSWYEKDNRTIEGALAVSVIVFLIGLLAPDPMGGIPDSTWIVDTMVLTEIGLFLMLLMGAFLFKGAVGWIGDLKWGNKTAKLGVGLLFTSPCLFLTVALAWEVFQTMHWVIAYIDTYLWGLRLANGLKTASVFLYLSGIFLYSIALRRSNIIAHREAAAPEPENTPDVAGASVPHPMVDREVCGRPAQAPSPALSAPAPGHSTTLAPPTPALPTPATATSAPARAEKQRAAGPSTIPSGSPAEPEVL